MRIVFVIIIVAALSFGSYATTVSVTTTSLASNTGTLTYVFFETGMASSTANPTVNTALTQPSGTGSTMVNRGNTIRLWSTQFTGARTLAAGVWIIDVWAAAASKTGTLTISIYITDSAGTVQTTIANSVSTPSMGTSKVQVSLQAPGSAASVPANGYIEVTLTAPTGNTNPTSFTVYWGKAQATNFQVPVTVVTA